MKLKEVAKIKILDNSHTSKEKYTRDTIIDSLRIQRREIETYEARH